MTFLNKMLKILRKTQKITSKSRPAGGLRNIRIIFNIVEKNCIDPFPVNKTDNRNQ